MNSDVGPVYSISASRSKAAAEWSTGMETFESTEPMMAASFNVTPPPSQSGNKMPLKKAAGLYSDFFMASYVW